MSGSELVVLEEENDVLVSDERLASHLKILENRVLAEPDLQVLDLDRTGYRFKGQLNLFRINKIGFQNK